MNEFRTVMLVPDASGRHKPSSTACAHGFDLFEIEVCCIDCRRLYGQILRDDVIVRRQENNPEWYRGSPHSPFFYRERQV